MDVSLPTTIKDPDSILIKIGRKRLSIVNCLFRCLAFSAYGSENAHPKMRSLLVTFVSLNASSFNALVFEGSIRTHVSKMKHFGEWGTQVELQAAATLFHKPSYVLTRSTNDIGDYDRIVYKPQFSKSISFPNLMFYRPSSQGTTLYLCLHRRCLGGKQLHRRAYSTFTGSFRTFQAVWCDYETECVLGVNNLEFLGHQVNSKGIKPLEEKVKAVLDFPLPPTRKKLRQFLGLINFYHRFIKNCVQTVLPLNELLSTTASAESTTLQWTEEAKTAFQHIKTALANATLLFHSKQDALTSIMTDASSRAVGADPISRKQ